MQSDCVREESSYRTSAITEKNLSDSGDRNTSENISASENLSSQVAPKPRWEEVLTQSQGGQGQNVVSTETEEAPSRTEPYPAPWEDQPEEDEKK